MVNKPHILIFEASATQATRFPRLLEQQEWSVTWTSLADAALNEIARTKPDLILVENFSPEMLGGELCRRLRVDSDTQRIPIIMLTGDDRCSEDLHALECGADCFVPQSIAGEVLLERIRKSLERNADADPPTSRSEAPVCKARLLVLSTDGPYLERLTSELTKEEYLLEHSSEGRDALDRMAREVFDCILVDLAMPEMDGIEICREINQLRRNMEAPVAMLLLTGKAPRNRLTRALEAGADDFVAKSAGMPVLKGRIRTLLRRKVIQEENRRILEELKTKEREAVQARTAREMAEARALLYEELETTAEELKRSQKELQVYAAELQRSNAELEQFAYIVSHDLKEPLRMVTSFTKLLAEELHESLTPQTERYLNYAAEGASRMQHLINDLLQFSRVNRDRKSFKSVDLDEILQTTLQNLSTTIQEAQATIHADPLPAVRGVPLLLMQLFQNLLSNALKFRSDKPPVIQIKRSLQDDRCTICVEDNGIGIDQKYQDRVFQIFQRLHTREQYEGTGIGLALCKKIVECHGGRIWFRSIPRQGTSFYFTLMLPAQREAGSGNAVRCAALV